MNYKNQYLYLLLAAFLGFLTGHFHPPYLVELAETLSQLFLNFLQLLALPIIFFAVVSTVTGMEDLRTLKTMGVKILSYTISTTLFASLVGLALYEYFSPQANQLAPQAVIPEVVNRGYMEFFMKIIPSNFVGAFLDYNVVGVVFIAFVIGVATLSQEKEKKDLIHRLFNSLFSVLISLANVIGILVPIAVWSFVTLFMVKVIYGSEENHLNLLGTYLFCVVLANLVQGFIVLPSLLYFKKISPVRLFKSMFPALTVAFFSKSSNATLPFTLDCAKNRFHIKEKVADVSIPLCSIINMNACAAFILISILFIASHSGVVFSGYHKILWVFIATLAAVGNAGVPMGCYLLTGALLSSLDIPLNMLGLILPAYTLLDMLETSINVWSDACITAIVDQELPESILKPPVHEAVS